MKAYDVSLMALIAYGAKGETAATAQNTNGGFFHLTDEKVEGGYRAFIVAMPQVAVLEGVWTWNDEGVDVAWSNGIKQHYPYDFWKPNMAICRKIGMEQLP